MKTVVWVLAAVLVLATLSLLWMLRRPQMSAVAKDPPVAASHRTTPSPAPIAAPPAAAPRELRGDAAAMPLAARPTPVPLAELLDDARARVRNAARPCSRHARGHAGDAYVSFDYTLVLTGAEAHVEKVVFAGGNVSDTALRECVLDAVGRVHWPIASDEQTLRQHETISIDMLR